MSKANWKLAGKIAGGILAFMLALVGADKLGMINLCIGPSSCSGVTPPANSAPSGPAVGSTPGPTPVPQATTIVTDLQTVSVAGNKVNGYQFTAGQAGTYRFQYMSGAYSVYPLGKTGPNGRPWRTAIFVYRGDRVPFHANGDINKEAAELLLADTTDSASKAIAEGLAQGSSWFEMELASGETITLVAVDGRFSYGDNPGAVLIKISSVQRTIVR